ncbi:MAG: uracil-DNA glycosylase [Deltaproteobacteria bacterium]|nr:uracil-DNA glycosylase [Deltaproteobacteria bacterium]MBW2019640.1 uracil-DNA glycosylase [Deltaproteobacteria bacterium]MBW2074172.1 uracil-DNA glycosylase [Deltaproteobacteria bacterium]
MTESVRTFHDGFSQNFLEITEDFKGYLQYMKGLRYEGVALSAEALSILGDWDRWAMGETLDMIQKDLGNCQRCKLHKRRKHIVFGAGNPRAKLVLVGEAPGHEEDIQGQPFVGEAGQLLTKVLRAIGLTREDVYICNVIKCRPPGNRNPEPDEIATCIPFLRRQLRAIRPKLICALGTFAAQTLLGTNIPISRLRGHFHTYEGIRLLPTYHPAFLLRNPSKKRDVWEDMQKLQKAYERV